MFATTTTPAAQPHGFIDHHIPNARVLHPWPDARFRVKHSRWEPGALAAPAGMCAGGGQQ